MHSSVHHRWQWGKLFILLAAFSIGLFTALHSTIFSAATSFDDCSTSISRIVTCDQEAVSLSINRIVAYFNNRGSLYQERGVAGIFWYDERFDVAIPPTVVYDHGLWILGKMDGVFRAAVVQWGSSYSPGPIIDGKPAKVLSSDSSRYRPYKITYGDCAETNRDYAEWPSDLGAPVDEKRAPRLFGNQTVWMVYNGADSTANGDAFREPFSRIPVEVHQLAFARAASANSQTDLLSNVIFLEWTLINKGDRLIDSTYVSLWSDLDFSNPSNNVPGVDTTLQLGYLWEGLVKGGDGNPPARAVGYVWLYGPHIPSPGDTAVYRGKKISNHRNLPITSFWGIIDDSGNEWAFTTPAYSMTAAWNLARGLDKRGNPIMDSTANRTTRFPYSGDPVTGAGWYYNWPYRGGGSGFNLFSGPFILAPNDTQWVMAALVPAIGQDRFDAIVKLRDRAAALRSMPYDSLIQFAAPDSGLIIDSTSAQVVLGDNYPNPFSNSTTIEFTLNEQTHSVLQVFDLLGRCVATLIDKDSEAGEFEITFNAHDLPSGVYLYRLRTMRSSVSKKFVLLR